MAQLPSTDYLIQQIAGRVVLFNRYSEDEIVSFDPSDSDAVSMAQGAIHQNAQLSDEDKCFAHFWSGYFYAHSTWIGVD